MFSYLQYLGGVFLGWSLGANDSANVFGTAVSSRMVNYRLAIFLTAIFVILGALLQGQAGIRTLSQELRSADNSRLESSEEYADTAMQNAMIASFAAAITVTLMTIVKIPVSTSQAVVGAIIGIGILQQDVRLAGLGKVAACWVGTPIGAMIFTLIFYYLGKKMIVKYKPHLFTYDPVVRLLLILTGCYGAYALGANNVANVAAVFVGKGMLSSFQAALFGGIAIAVGAMSYSKPVMMTVGKGIIQLDAFSALVCVLAHAVTVHIYAMIGVPVSTSQAIVGAVLGIALIKGAQAVNYRMLMRISAGWLATPFVAAVFAAVGHLMLHLRYQ